MSRKAYEEAAHRLAAASGQRADVLLEGLLAVERILLANGVRVPDPIEVAALLARLMPRDVALRQAIAGATTKVSELLRAAQRQGRVKTLRPVDDDRVVLDIEASGGVEEHDATEFEEPVPADLALGLLRTLRWPPGCNFRRRET